MVVGINCGHTVSGTIGSGASGLLDESNETRAIGYELMRYLKESGHTVIDCTNDYASSVNENLRSICSIANSFPLDIFLSIHLNAGGGHGAEVLTLGANDKAFANSILNGLEAMGFRNRGIKDGSSLYVLRNTNAPSALIEVCFVDNQTDYNKYTSIGADKIARTICEAITEQKSKGDSLSMTQYEELKQMIQNITPVIYNYIDENMPTWAVHTVQKLVNRGIIKGDENGLGLTENDLRHLVWNDRAGLYDK